MEELEKMICLSCMRTFFRFDLMDREGGGGALPAVFQEAAACFQRICRLS